MTELSNKNRDTGFVGKTHDVIKFACNAFGDCVTMTSRPRTSSSGEDSGEFLTVTSSPASLHRLVAHAFDAAHPFLVESLVGKRKILFLLTF